MEPVEFKVGDIVESFGLRGVVTTINDSVFAEFKTSDAAFSSYVYMFYLDGRLEPWHPSPTLKLIERPKKLVKMTPEREAEIKEMAIKCYAEGHPCTGILELFDEIEALRKEIDALCMEPVELKFGDSSWVIIDLKTKPIVIKCLHCGEEYPFEITEVDILVAYGKAFLNFHRQCKKLD